MILPSDGLLGGNVATVRSLYASDNLSVMLFPGSPGTAGMLISPDTGMIHYLVSHGDWEFFKRGD